MSFAEKLLSQRGPRALMDKKILLLSRLRSFVRTRDLGPTGSCPPWRVTLQIRADRPDDSGHKCCWEPGKAATGKRLPGTVAHSPQ